MIIDRGRVENHIERVSVIVELCNVAMTVDLASVSISIGEVADRRVWALEYSFDEYEDDNESRAVHDNAIENIIDVMIAIRAAGQVMQGERGGSEPVLL